MEEIKNTIQPLTFTFQGRPVRSILKRGFGVYLASDICALLEINEAESLAMLAKQERPAHSIRHLVTSGELDDEQRPFLTHYAVSKLIRMHSGDRHEPLMRWFTDVQLYHGRNGAYGMAHNPASDELLDFLKLPQIS